MSLHRPDLTQVHPHTATTGPDDPMWTTAAARAAAAHLPTGALVILPGAGQIGSLLQAAPQVAQLLTAFWRDPRPPSTHKGRPNLSQAPADTGPAVALRPPAAPACLPSPHDSR